ncbi:MAG TPA: DUF4276 family protein [Thermoanaerobaculia bacterium]|jgi:hypothetical protein|nr:DUF4276 family protein [Thermoanaerobaculia bacterium]
MILPVVEGLSEVQAVPVLLRRLLARLGREDIQIARPFRVSRLKVVRPGELERAILQGSRDRNNLSALLVLLDADDDDPASLEIHLMERCHAATALPAAVIAARREFESWFLGGKDAFRGFRGIRPDANAPPDPESIRGAKERLSRNMAGRSYVEVDDQPAFAERLDLELASQRCASLRRLMAELERIAKDIPLL